MHERFRVAERIDNLGFDERHHDSFDAVGHGATTFGPHERANPPPALEKTTRDVPPDEAGGARHHDAAAHAMAF